MLRKIEIIDSSNTGLKTRLCIPSKPANYTIGWISGGVSSFIATYLLKDKIDFFVYEHIDNAHEDTERFLIDCAKVLPKDIIQIKSIYKSVNDIQQTFRFINSPYGAKCTDVLKKRLRKEYLALFPETSTFTLVWGLDVTNKTRMLRICDTMTEYTHEFPLCTNNVTKKQAHSMLEKLNITRPYMYELGYGSNNCVGCVKGGKNYWWKIKQDFPARFNEQALMEREIKATCIKNVYLDELTQPKRLRNSSVLLEECDSACNLIY